MRDAPSFETTEEYEASSRTDAQTGGSATHDRCLPCPLSYTSCASTKEPAMKTSWSCEQAAPLTGAGCTRLMTFVRTARISACR